ncbi:hypothetical protein ACS5PK_01945 [Roseateles sp. DB2]|uniref:hypothetical protein n=1 Tax=Roseateles sp. DB2 TaxID=3453717 RepID=UPI003EEC5A3D
MLLARLFARLCALAILPASLALAPSAQAAEVGISLSLMQPGVYGRIDIGPQYRPDVVYAEPVWIQRPRRVYRAPTPIYLYAPPHHVRDWGRYCGGYGACGQPVLFIEDRWVRNWHDHRGWEHAHGRGHGHDRGHGHGHGHGRDRNWDRDDDHYAPQRGRRD